MMKMVFIRTYIIYMMMIVFIYIHINDEDGVQLE